MYYFRFMKRVSILALTVSVFYSCSKSDGKTNAPSDKTLIIGKWGAVTNIITIKSKDGTLSKPDTINLVSLMLNDYMTFDADETGIDVQGASSQPFTYTIQNNAVALHYSNIVGSFPLANPYDFNAQIKRITSSSLELYYTIGPDTQDGHTQFEDITYTR